LTRSAAVLRLVGDRRRLAALGVDEERLAGHVERRVGQDVGPVPLHHDAVGGEEEDGVLGGTPRSVIHRGVELEPIRAAFPTDVVDDLRGGQLRAGVGHLALHRVVAHQLALLAEQVDVAQLVRIGVALEALRHVGPLEPAAGLHGLLGVRHGLDGRAADPLRLVLGLVLGGVRSTTVTAPRHDRQDGEQRDEPQELLLGLSVRLHAC